VPDYGQDLEFGVFLTPDADRASEVVEQAQLADVLGLDLVTIQDHPYQARHLDAWTLLAAIAARTSAVRVAPNVANLPLRPPAVLAGAVATLDILSDGRAELGLGAGAFWDAVVAAGGPRRTPGEAVEALEEAIAVIRGVWGVDGNRNVDVDGRHYRVKGLRAGPAPVHEVGIWIGAYKPRMLRLTGRLADGWVPSLGPVQPDDLPELHAIIDEAAAKAGRPPQAIRRMLNVSAGLLTGSSADRATQLAALALDRGVDTFILASDESDEIRRFATEIVPATRDLVDAARTRRSPVVEGGAPALVTKPSQQSSAPLPNPTPHDGLRLSATLPWDESTRPTYAVPDDASYVQSAAPQHLVDIHDHLRSELAQVRDIVDQVRRGQLAVGAARSVINTMTMRQNNWTLGAYCESYCRIVTGHHTLEDHSVFTHLRRGDPDLGAVLDRLAEEHVVIHDVLEQVDDALVGLVGGPSYGADATANVDELQRSLDLLTDTLLSHLAYEERELIHPLAMHGFS
jgi:alkanesulfonate monooxygenase SsuD/methylene tetrahydromethanopterin reductase-like flavin-dependent oxidoreductase (luciferase family)